MASNLRHLLSCGTIAVGVILEFSHKPGSMEYILFSQEVISGKEYALPQIHFEDEAPTAVPSGSLSPFDYKSIFEIEQR